MQREAKMSNIESAIDGLDNGFRKRLIQMPSENASILANFILSIKHESASISNSHRCNIIKAVYYLSAHLDNIPFKSITRNDFMSFLDSFRKPDNVDSMHKWIGTYNLYYSLLCRFFKWLYYPDMAPDKRPEPEVIQNIARQTRKEISNYKPTG